MPTLGTVGMLINVVLSVSVSLVTKPPPKEIVDRVENIRHPG